MITTQKQLRAEFWRTNPQFRRTLTRDVEFRRNRYAFDPEPVVVLRNTTQNEYPTDVRVSWCDFVECMYRAGQISEALADRATL